LNTRRSLKRIGDYDRLQGITLLTNIISIVRNASNDFWWSDPISSLSILDHAREHFDLVINLWQEVPGELAAQASMIQNTFIPLVEAQRSISQVQHFTSLANSAIEVGEIVHASSYFTKASDELNKAKTILTESNDPTAFMMLDSIADEEGELEIISSLARLATIYEQAVSDLAEGKNDSALKACTDIAKFVKKLESAVNH